MDPPPPHWPSPCILSQCFFLAGFWELCPGGGRGERAASLPGSGDAGPVLPAERCWLLGHVDTWPAGVFFAVIVVFSVRSSLTESRCSGGGLRALELRWPRCVSVEGAPSGQKRPSVSRVARAAYPKQRLGFGVQLCILSSQKLHGALVLWSWSCRSSRVCGMSCLSQRGTCSLCTHCPTKLFSRVLQ